MRPGENCILCGRSLGKTWDRIIANRCLEREWKREKDREKQSWQIPMMGVPRVEREEEEGGRWRTGEKEDGRCRKIGNWNFWHWKWLWRRQSQVPLCSPLFGSSQPCNEGRSNKNRLLGVVWEGEEGRRGGRWGQDERGGMKEGKQWGRWKDRGAVGRYRLKRRRTLKGEMMMLSENDVNRGGYIVNRYSRLAVQAGPCLSCSGTDKWNIFRRLNQRKMGFHLLAYPLCCSRRENDCLSLFLSLSLSPERAHWTLQRLQKGNLSAVFYTTI